MVFSPLGQLAIKVTRNEDPPSSPTKAFLKEENLSLEDFEWVIWGEVHTQLCYLSLYELCVSLQKVPDTIVGVPQMDTTNLHGLNAVH